MRYDNTTYYMVRHSTRMRLPSGQAGASATGAWGLAISCLLDFFRLS